MFCRVCGTQNPDHAAFCKGCGNQLKERAGVPTEAPARTPARVQSQAYQSRQPARRNDHRQDKKIGIIAVGAAAAVVLILIFVLFGGRGYKATVKQFFKATFDADGEAIVDLLPDDLLDYVLDEAGYDEDELDEFIEEIEDEIEDQLAYIERYLGDDLDFSYKIVDSEDIKGDDLKDIKKEYKRAGVKVSAAKEVEVELTVKAGKTENEDTITISVIKVGRSWYLDLDSMGSLL